MTSNFSEKRVLVTGASGFIGSWLTESLLENGADVSVLINKEGPIGNAGISHIMNKVKPFYGNITKPETIKESLKDQEIIFHLAALTQVSHSFNIAKEFFHVNTLGTINILDQLKNSKSLEFLVFSSTDKVYGEPQHLPIKEDHALSAKSPYDVSKLAAEFLIDSYHRSYGLPAGRVRWSNTIGGRDVNILRALPDFVTSIINGKSITIRGDGKQIRDYLYVTDAVSGILAVAKNMNKTNGKVFNLGTERPTSVLELANLVIDKMEMKDKMKLLIKGKNNPGEINQQYLSAKKAKQELKWSPKVKLEEGIVKTIRWYIKHPDWYKVMLKVKNYWSTRLMENHIN